MPYRMNGFDAAAASDDARETEREIARMAREAERRKTRAALGVAAAVLATMGAVASFVTVARSPASSPTRCHHVEIRWENASNVPGWGWTACR